MADPKTIAAILGEGLDKSARAMVEYNDLCARHARELADLQAIQRVDADRARAEMLGLGVGVAGLLGAHLQRLFPGAAVTVTSGGSVNLRPSDHKSLITISTTPQLEPSGLTVQVRLFPPQIASNHPDYSGDLPIGTDLLTSLQTAISHLPETATLFTSDVRRAYV